MSRIEKIYLIDAQDGFVDWDSATEAQKQESKGVFVKYHQRIVGDGFSGSWNIEVLRKLLEVETPEERKHRLSDHWQDL